MAFAIACDSEPKYTSKPSECYKLEEKIRYYTSHGLNFNDREAHLRKDFGSQSKLDKVKDLCTDYYKHKYDN